MANEGAIIQLNVKVLESKFWEGLEPSLNEQGKDYKKYILENPDRVYTVWFRNEYDEVVLDDDFLKTTSFFDEELIVIGY